MGSASRIALAQARQLLDGLGASNETGSALLDASSILESDPNLLAVVADAAADEAAKVKLVETVFTSAPKEAQSVLQAVAKGRWSNSAELVSGVEELGIRADAKANGSLDEELLAIEKVIASDHELELTLGSKLIAPEAKKDLATKLFGGKVSDSALKIVQHTVANPRGRRLGRALQDFAKVIADQSGKALATVTVASPLSGPYIQKLEEALAAEEGRPVKVTSVVDPKIIGGMSIRIGDRVIDGTVKSRLDNLRLKLAL